jgi:hypothetical protein
MSRGYGYARLSYVGVFACIAFKLIYAARVVFVMVVGTLH